MHLEFRPLLDYFNETCMAYSTTRQRLEQVVEEGRLEANASLAGLTTKTLEERGLYLHVSPIEELALFEADSGKNLNYAMLSNTVVVFIYELWEGDYRQQLAELLGIKAADVSLPLVGDIRILRNAIVHNQAQLSQAKLQKLSVLREFFSTEERIRFSPVAIKVLMESMVDSVREYASGRPTENSLITDSRLFQLCHAEHSSRIKLKLVFDDAIPRG